MKLKKHKDTGQTLVEFLLLLAVIFGLSYGILTVGHQGVADLWKTMIRIVIYPSTEEIEIR